MAVPAPRRPRLAVPALALAVALGLAACGGDGADGADASGGETTAAASAATSSVATDGATDGTQSAEEMAEEMAQNLEERQAAEGGGSARLTAGERTWDFDAVLCAVGEEETGQAGAEFVLSSIKDGLQFYVSVDTFGHSVSLSDIEDFEDPSVALFTDGSDGEFITVDGRNVSGEMTLVDENGTDRVDASFEGTCP